MLKTFLLIFLFKIEYTYKACPNMEHFETDLIIMKTLSNFFEFNQLDFKTCQSVINITALRIKPSKRIILDNSLDFMGLKLIFPKDYFIIAFNNIKGIDLGLNSFTSLNLYSFNNFVL